MTKLNEKLYDNICDSINNIFINIDEIIKKEQCMMGKKSIYVSYYKLFVF